MNHIMDIHKGDIYFSSSDIGWVVGHTFIIYGPLIRGATTVLYEVNLSFRENPIRLTLESSGHLLRNIK